MDLELVRVDHPHAVDPGLEIVIEPGADRLGLFRSADDFHHEIRHDVPSQVPGYMPVGRPAGERDERQVGMKLLVSRLAPGELCVLGHMADFLRFRMSV